MIEQVGQIGSTPERLVYRDLRLERKGFLSLFSFTLDGVRHRFEAMARGEAVVVLPADFARRELYILREIRPLVPFGQDAEGKAALARLMERGADHGFEIDAVSARIYEFPAGMIDQGETSEQAAVRELREETGLSVEAARLRRVLSAFPSVGGSIERVHLFIADLAEAHAVDRQAAQGDGGEQIEIVKMGWDDAFELVAKGEIEVVSTGLLLRELMILDMRQRSG